MSMSEEKKHAKYSASGSKRWLTCPASIYLSEGLVSQSSAAAQHGTDAHTCLETFLKNPGKVAQTFSMLSKTFPDTMVMDAKNAAKEIWAIRDAMPGSDLLIEEKVSLEFVGPDMFGTVDAAIVQPFGQLIVIDFKYGTSPVSALENTQLIYYALGLAHKYGFSFESVRVRIIQPRSSAKSQVTECEVLDLESYIDVFKKGRAACEDFIAPVVPGDHCFFCPAKKSCPAHAPKFEAKTMAGLEDLGGVADVDDYVPPPEPGTMWGRPPPYAMPGYTMPLPAEVRPEPHPLFSIFSKRKKKRKPTVTKKPAPKKKPKLKVKARAKTKPKKKAKK